MMSLYHKTLVFTAGRLKSGVSPVLGKISIFSVSISRQPFAPPRKAGKHTRSGLGAVALTAAVRSRKSGSGVWNRVFLKMLEL